MGPEPRIYCCCEFAQAFNQRQIYPSMDEFGGWNVRVDLTTDALMGIRFCPFCGERLPNASDMEPV